MLNEKNLEVLKEEFNLIPDEKTVEKVNLWHKMFLEYNSHTNLMSRGDTDKLFEKHVFDSLAVLKWDEFDPSKKQKILDAGTGGGFPSVILALFSLNLKLLQTIQE